MITSRRRFTIFFVLSKIRYDELKDLIRVVKNSQKIKDVAKVLSGQHFKHLDGTHFYVCSF